MNSRARSDSVSRVVMAVEAGAGLQLAPPSQPQSAVLVSPSSAETLALEVNHSSDTSSVS